VQLAAQVLARAAAHEGREVQMLGTYGGTMRGGNTDSTLVIADGPISAPPMVSRSWALIAMHHQFAAPLLAKLRPQGVAMLNSSLFEGALDRRNYRVFDVPATQLGTELGNAMTASLVLIAAFARATGIVSLASLEAAMRESVPSYRVQHIALNEKALRTGFETLPAGVAPAWASGASAGSGARAAASPSAPGAA
jgi:Pyruvate/2-oxoacid:ferredoxin oxidoreductase gamma subunit